MLLTGCPDCLPDFKAINLNILNTNTVLNTSENTKRTPEEFAANYDIAKSDGSYNVTIGNVNEFDGKIFVNLCLKTAKSGAKNAVYVRPVPGTPSKFGVWGELPYFIVKGKEQSN